jgi:hypothetical protein
MSWLRTRSNAVTERHTSTKKIHLWKSFPQKILFQRNQNVGGKVFFAAKEEVLQSLCNAVFERG